MSKEAISAFTKIEQENTFSADYEAETACGRLFVILQRIHADNNHTSHEPELIRRAVELINSAPSYAIYLAKIDECIMNIDYISAINIGEALIQHESMLHEIASNGKITRTSTLN